MKTELEQLREQHHDDGRMAKARKADFWPTDRRKR